MDSYVPEYVPGGMETRTEWLSDQRRRMAGPPSVELSIESPRMRLLADGRIRIEFTETARLPSGQTNTRKTVEMVQQASRWLIASEDPAGD